MSKPWERPWSMEEIIDCSENWSLAGDVALLNTLKSFADNLLKRANETNDEVTSLTENLDEAALRLDLAQNQFRRLKNTQFIESRVYEDDETLPPDEAAGQAEKKEPEIDHTEDIKRAFEKGLKVLDEYFEKVEVSVSDSEDDNNFPSYMLRPKDRYIDRPLPYVIGTEEWHKSWHVGLEDSSSGSETEKNSEDDKFSETDSESDLPVRDRSQIKGTSDTSSELDFSSGKVEKAAATAALRRQEDDIFADQGAHRPEKSFAETLAAKLGDVITGRAETETAQVNTRPIQQPGQQKRYSDNLFFDEPPPLDEGPPGEIKGGLFSGGGGLFDDDEEEEDDWGSPVQSKAAVPKKKMGGLFDDDVTDDDITPNIASTVAKKSILLPPKAGPSLPLFSEEPPALEDELTEEKRDKEKRKPIGGVSILGGSNLFDKKLLLRKRQSSSDEDDEEEKIEKVVKEAKDKPPEPKPRKAAVEKKKMSLFDSDDDEEEVKIPPKKVDLFDSNDDKVLPEKAVAKKDERKKVSLFPNDEEATKIKEEKKKVDLFDDEVDNVKAMQKEEKGSKKFSLFDDDDLFKDDLFSSASSSKTKKLTLFDDEDEFSLAGDESSINSKGASGATGGALSADLFGEKEKLKVTSRGLFDSPPPETDDDLFATPSKLTQPSKNFKEPPPLEEPPEDTYGDANKTPDESIYVENNKSKDTSSGLFDSPSPKTDYLFETPVRPIESKRSFEEPPPLEEPPKDDFASGVTRTTTSSSGGLFDSPPPDADFDDLFGAPPLIKSRLFDDEDDDIGSLSKPHDDDLFGDVTATPTDATDRLFSSDDLFKKPQGSTSGVLFDDDTPPPDDVIFKPPDLPKPPITKTKPEKIGDETKDIKRPGKLKHNLNINVGALIPGSAPPKRAAQPAVKTVESSPPMMESQPVFPKETTEPPSFDATDNVEVLHSVTKDRAKVPFQRRPSTRRARQAALRISGSDFKLEKGADEKDENISPLMADKSYGLFDEKIEKSALDEPKSESSEKVDVNEFKSGLFDEPADTSTKGDPTGLFEEIHEKPVLEGPKGDQNKENNKEELKTGLFEEALQRSLLEEPKSIQKQKSEADKNEFKTGLFDDFLRESEDKVTETKPKKVEKVESIFDEKAVVPERKSKKVEPKTKAKTVGLFSDEDDEDDDLFGSSTKKMKAGKSLKKSLFEDDDDEDDIFQSSSSASATVKRQQTKFAVEKKIPKVSKLEKPEDDPLSDLL